MEDAFSAALADWTGFYALMGGAAATLLGLLFVALSLRLNIFHQRNVADVRDFAAFTFGTFLVAIAVAGLMLAPHGRRGALALALALVGVGGLIASAWVARAWLQLNAPSAAPQPEFGPPVWQGWGFMVGMVLSYVVLVAVAFLLWRGHPDALGALAIVEGWLLGVGAVAAWIMLSHAGAGREGAGS
jgi:hypothetical protein